MATSGCTFCERTSIAMWDSEQAYRGFGKHGLSLCLLEETREDLGGGVSLAAAAPAIFPPFVHPFIHSLLPFLDLSFTSQLRNTARYPRSWKGRKGVEPWIVPPTTIC